MRSHPISPHPQPLSPEYQGEGGTEQKNTTDISVENFFDSFVLAGQSALH
ncbi:MAG: hypothetical protein JWM11_4010 [Planctomycetaceae bacterium]|nr:hypothetical protein [Planctomycetaceae bacterium]